jgi:hypothetical protein
MTITGMNRCRWRDLSQGDIPLGQLGPLTSSRAQTHSTPVSTLVRHMMTCKGRSAAEGLGFPLTEDAKGFTDGVQGPVFGFWQTCEVKLGMPFQRY